MRSNSTYKQYHSHVLVLLILSSVMLMVIVGVIIYQLLHRPVPIFYAQQPSGQRLALTDYDEPNLLPDTLLRWASKVATMAYTFDFVNYAKEIELTHPYFTADGWQDYLRSVDALIDTIIKNQLFVSGVVSGSPVISNQGVLPKQGYSWRVQIPFLVTYQSANTTSKQSYYILLTIVRVPTAFNPQGIGVDQFVMV